MTTGKKAEQARVKSVVKLLVDALLVLATQAVYYLKVEDYSNLWKCLHQRSQLLSMTREILLGYDAPE